jgi:hypothetical protein
LGVRLRQGANGIIRKTYRIQYRVGLQQRSKHLDVRRVKPEDARKVARQLFAKAHLGVRCRAAVFGGELLKPCRNLGALDAVNGPAVQCGSCLPAAARRASSLRLAADQPVKP